LVMSLDILISGHVSITLINSIVVLVPMEY
jgi:hypothetical protein